MDVHISFKPEDIFTIGNFAVTNSLFTGVLVFLFLVVFFLILKVKLNRFNPGTLELVFEMLYDGLYSLAENILGPAAKKYFGFLFTLFIFILVANWAGLIPLVPSLGVVHEKESGSHAILVEEDTILATDSPMVYQTMNVEEEKEKGDIGCLLSGKCLLTSNGIEKDLSFIPVLRPIAADLSGVLAFAIISVFVTNLIGFMELRFSYFKKYINFSSPIDFVVGILEIISEIGKIVSFGFRLFGNIFAGEVVLVVITALSFGIATFPFLVFEVFVGVVQAMVFFMLTSVFIGLARESHH